MNTQKRYLELDALRGVAAIFVVFFHFTLGHQHVYVFNLGVTAVDLFFIISGFVIFMSINNVSSGRQFVINRLSRLYPVYWTCVTISFGVMMLLKVAHFPINHANNAGIIVYLGNMTMFQYYLNIPDLDIPYWTMIIEMLFYLLILLLFELKLLKYITGIGCVINLLVIINYVLVTNNVVANYTKLFPLVNHFALFFAGITFYKIANNLQNKVPGYLIVVFCLLTQLTIFKFSGSDPDHVNFYQYAIMLLFYFSIFTLFINNKLKFVIIRPIVFLGKISFALYLIHSYLFMGLIGYLEKHSHLNFWVIVLLIAVPAAIMLAVLITNYIEKPYGKKLKNLLQNYLMPTVSAHPVN